MARNEPAHASSASSDAEPRRTVLRGLGFTSIGYPLNVAFIFFTQVLAARLLTRDDFGSYALAVSIFSTVALIMQLGLPHSMLRRASASLSDGRGSAVRNEIVSAFILATAAAVVIAVAFASPIGREALDAVFSETGVALFAGLIGVRTGLRILENLVPEALRAFRAFLAVSVYDGLLTNFLLLVALTVVLLADGSPDAADLMALSVATAAVALAPAGWAIHRKLRVLDHERLRIHNPLEPAMWMVTVGRALLSQLDLLLVGVLATSAQVATYAVPFRLALFVGFPLIVVNQVVPPLIASWHAGGAVERLERTLRATAGLAFLGALAIAAVYVIAGRLIIGELFGAKYEDGYTVLLILSAGQVLQTYAGSCGFALMMTGNQRAYAWLLGISTIVTAALDIAAFQVWGIEGIALATAVSLTVQNFVQAAMLRRRTGFHSIADVRLALTEGVSTLRRTSRRGRARAGAAEVAASGGPGELDPQE
ncbi:MAG: lipopolysaccharide biosynthesis protein [Actinomycetota bacterium]